jgi:hypothetical protein
MMMYISPDTIMPLASAVAAVVGVAVMFWHKIKQFFRAVFAKFGRSADKGA